MGDPEPTGTNGVYLDQQQSTLQGSLFEAFSTHNNGALSNASPGNSNRTAITIKSQILYFYSYKVNRVPM
jgi:hypothetical protein